MRERPTQAEVGVSPHGTPLPTIANDLFPDAQDEGNKACRPERLAGDSLSIAPRDDHHLEAETDTASDASNRELAPLRRIEPDAPGRNESVRPEKDRADQLGEHAGTPLQIAPHGDDPCDVKVGQELELPKPLAPLRRIEPDAHGHNESVRPEGDRADQLGGFAGIPLQIAPRDGIPCEAEVGQELELPKRIAPLPRIERDAYGPSPPLDSNELLHEHFCSPPIRPKTTKPEEHRGKRLHPNGAFYPYQTKTAKRDSRGEKEEAKRFAAIYDQLTNPENHHTLVVVISVKNKLRYFKTTGNAGSEGRMALLVPGNGAADGVIAQALLSYGLRDSTLESCGDGRICREAVILCEQLKGLTMSQLVSRTSTFAERGTNLDGGLRFYSCNTETGDV